jgi:hypothetical protein
MDATNTAMQSDVLHFENHVELSAAEIAKAVAHHNHHHAGPSLHIASSKSKPVTKSH